MRRAAMVAKAALVDEATTLAITTAWYSALHPSPLACLVAFSSLLALALALAFVLVSMLVHVVVHGVHVSLSSLPASPSLLPPHS